MDGRAKQSTFHGNGFACIKANPHADGVVRVLSIMLCKGLLDSYSTCDSTGGGKEGRFDAIAGMGDLRAVVTGQAIADKGIVDA